VLVAAIIIFVILKKRKKKVVQPPKPVFKGTALERAIERLRELEALPLTTFEQIKSFHTQIDIICRQYFEEMMHVKAMQATTGELFSRMNVYMQDPQLRSKFLQIFDLNASVKFAKFVPFAEYSKSTLRDVILCLQKIDT